MEYIENFRQWLITQFPIIGLIIAIVGALIYINNLIGDLTVDKVNPLKSAINVFSRKASKFSIKNRKKYRDNLAEKQYFDWLTQVLYIIYNNYEFPKIFDSKYPVICFPAQERCEYPFSNVLDKKNLILNAKEYNIKSPIHKEYRSKLGTTIKRPLLKGYMLEKIVFDTENKISSIQAKVSNYEQNIYTSHILEYELYNLYIKDKKEAINYSRTKLLDKLPNRKKIHSDRCDFELVTTGINRNSMLGVQMFVMYLDAQTNEYNVLMMKRSDSVAAKAGFCQFLPSGGFEIFQERNDENVLKESFSLQLALFRELLEEAFGNHKYEHNHNDLPISNILYEPQIKYIMDLINKKKAFFEFLGSVNDLVVLRHLLTFIIRIDDVLFSQQAFGECPEESKLDAAIRPVRLCEGPVRLTTVKNLAVELKNEKLCNDSAGIFHLVQKNHLYTEVINS